MSFCHYTSLMHVKSTIAACSTLLMVLKLEMQTAYIRDVQLAPARRSVSECSHFYRALAGCLSVRLSHRSVVCRRYEKIAILTNVLLYLGNDKDNCHSYGLL